MPLPKLVVVKDPRTAEVDTGIFVRIWEDGSEAPTFASRRLFSGEVRTKLGGMLMPHSDEENFERHCVDSVFRLIRGIFGSQEQTVFMTHKVAEYLIPRMVQPTLPIDLSDVSVDGSLRKDAIATFSLNFIISQARKR